VNGLNVVEVLRLRQLVRAVRRINNHSKEATR
jgi:hypothetical protein